MSPEIKEDSDCFLTVSFHILLIRLCQVNKGQSLGLLNKPAYLRDPLFHFYSEYILQTISLLTCLLICSEERESLRSLPFSLIL